MSEGHPRYYQILDEMRSIYEQKAHDYSGDEPFSDLKEVAELGVEPWVGVIIRMVHKFGRIKQACKGKLMVNETINDTLLDIANYAIIAIILRENSINK